METFNKITGIIFGQLIWAGFILAAGTFAMWVLRIFLENFVTIVKLIEG